MTSADLTLFFAWNLLKIQDRKARRRLANLKWAKKYPARKESWRIKNQKQINARHRQLKAENPERVREYQRKWREKNPNACKNWCAKNPEKKKAADRRWLENNRVRANTAVRIRRARNGELQIKEKIANLCRHRVLTALKGKRKSAATMQLMGCTIEEFRAHLAKQFRPGMSWETFGLWEIDHIRPCASFDLADPAQQRACFHFSNTQPLWRLENILKSDSYAG